MTNAKPILFTGDMVRAILDGRKTQTRRVLKSAFPKEYPQPLNLAEHGEGDRGYSGKSNDPHSWGYPYAEDGCDMTLADWANSLCPYGSIGDYLWVRENTEIDRDTCGRHGIDVGKYCADGTHIVYPGPEVDENGDDDYGGSLAHWEYSRDKCPSIHMPRMFSRLTLQITDIRVQRVQDITEHDALAEGTDRYPYDGQIIPLTGQQAFRELWDYINAPRGFGWKENPWVWAITFTPMLCNIDQILLSDAIMAAKRNTERAYQ